MTYTDSALPTPSGRWNRIAAYLVERRVRITLAVFVVLMIEDVLIGIEPHDLLDFRDPESLVGLGLIVAGLALRSWSAGILRKTRELTTTGPYSIIRNPLYVGSFMIMAGFCTIIDDPENIWIVLGPLAGLYILQILHEERTLAKLYGDRWDAYASSVPRLLPRRLPRTTKSKWTYAQWAGSREYNAFAATLIGLLAVQVWRGF
jgi:protein-S-isoprenylcysteine O-methyltransferase Ste14